MNSGILLSGTFLSSTTHYVITLRIKYSVSKEFTVENKDIAIRTQKLILSELKVMLTVQIAFRYRLFLLGFWGKTWSGK